MSFLCSSSLVELTLAVKYLKEKRKEKKRFEFHPNYQPTLIRTNHHYINNITRMNKSSHGTGNGIADMSDEKKQSPSQRMIPLMEYFHPLDQPQPVEHPTNPFTNIQSNSSYTELPPSAPPLPPSSNVPSPGSSPDIDYESTGHGFVSRTAVTRSLSQSIRRLTPIQQRRQYSTPLPSLTPMQRRRDLSLRKEMDGTKEKQEEAEDDLTWAKDDDKGGRMTRLRQMDKSAEKDIKIDIPFKVEDKTLPSPKLASIEDVPLWSLTLNELNGRFPTSGLNVNSPEKSVGLTSEEAGQRFHQYGRNELTPHKDHSEIVKYLLFYTDPFMMLLAAAGILAAAIAYPLDRSQGINLYMGIVLWTIVILSCSFAYWQEGKASSVMGSFKSMLPAQAKVIRGGHERQIPASEIVPGDILRFGGGDVIPADVRLIWTQDCKVETSSLTGESLPITCSINSPNTFKIEQAKNICFNSSKCLEGESLGIAFATGDSSLIGQIAGMAGATSEEDTTLQKEIKLFVRNLTLFSLVVGIILFVVAMVRGSKVMDAIINAFIIVMIANVPEGLPVTVVLSLTITAKRMASKKVFIKQLQSVETLGSVTVIATDKTGTLTQNIMAVANLWFDGHIHSSDAIGSTFPPHRIHQKTNTFKGGMTGGESYHMGSTLDQLELIAILCSKAKFEDERLLTSQQAKQLEQISELRSMDPTMTMRQAKLRYPTLYSLLQPGATLRSGRIQMMESLSQGVREDSSRKVQGDASETALFIFVRQRVSIELIRYHHPIVYSLPFNSRNKYAITITRSHELANESSNKRTLWMKGAPEVIVNRCSHYMNRGEIFPCDQRFKADFEFVYETFGTKGQRVLGFAMLELPEDKFGGKFDDMYASQPEAIPTSGLIFVGLISLVDPPKESVPQAVLDATSAGIKVIMVTGDHPLTAAAIARQVNIFESGKFTREELAILDDIPEEDVPDEDVDCVVVNGTELDEFTPVDWLRTLSKANIVFARTTPQQKLQIVEHLQAMGHIVAATGDGVNDSPALKKADIGVAMGINGSDVARDASNVILMDDNFASIVLGVREGRTIFDNLTKTIAYTLTHMLPEVMTIFLTIAFGMPPALSPLAILTIDLFTEPAPAISIAYEPSESDVMKKPPRNAKKDRLVTKKVVAYALLQAGVVETGCALLGYFLVFQHYGISASMLFMTPYFNSLSPRPMPTSPNCLTHPIGDGPFSPNQVCWDTNAQDNILRESQTAYYAIVVWAQVFHIWLCKTRNESIFRHGLLRNEVTIWAVALEICVILLIILPPSSNQIFFTRPFPPQFWPIIFIAPLLLLIWQEGRKWYVRRYPNSFIAKKVHW